MPDESKARRIAVSGDGKYLIAGTWGGRIFALNGETGEIIREYRTRHSTEVRAIAFHPDDKMFATISLERAICFWNVEQEECVRAIPYSIGDKPTCLSFNSTGDRIAVSSENREKYALVYDVESGELTANYGGYGENIMAVNFSPDDRFVITGDKRRRVVIWDAVTKAPVWTDDSSGGDGANDIYRVILTPTQDRLIVASGYNPTVYEMPVEVHREMPPEEVVPDEK
jgi:WD40 repeat protein